MKTLYGWESDARADPDYQKTRFALKFCIIRPLCWLGLLWEDWEGPGFFDEGTFYKTPLWTAALSLESGHDKDSGQILIQGWRRGAGRLSVCVMAGRRSGARVAATGRARSRRTG